MVPSVKPARGRRSEAVGGAPRPARRACPRRGAALTLLLLLVAGEARAERQRVIREARAMGTLLRLVVLADDPAAAGRAIDEAVAEIARLERLWSPRDPSSDVSRVNQAAGVAPVAVARETLAILEQAARFSRLSHGAFDVTFQALGGLWRFGDDAPPRLPDPAEVARRRRLVDHRRLRLDHRRGTAFLERPGMALGLGGIGKGHAVDRATEILRRRGFPDALVQLGGDLMLAGSSDGRPWQAGVRDPRGPVDDHFAVAAIVDRAFSTAGDYERSFLLDGRRYHHILDPRTGAPATACRSVTLWAPDALTADGLDDAVFVLGPRAGLALVESLPDVGAVIVDAANRLHVSRRLAGAVRIVHPPTDGP